ncbi:hypothetical protein [Persephonella sp.]
MSEQFCFVPHQIHYASMNLKTDNGIFSLYFSFKTENIKENQIEIVKTSPSEIERIFLEKKEADLMIKKGGRVFKYRFQNIRKSKKFIKAELSFQGIDRRRYFRMNLKKFENNKFVLSKKFQLLSSQVHIKDVSLDPESYKLITGIGIIIPKPFTNVIDLEDVLTISGKNLKVKFEVRRINEKDECYEIGGNVLTAEKDSYKIVSSLYNDTIELILKKYR